MGQGSSLPLLRAASTWSCVPGGGGMGPLWGAWGVLIGRFGSGRVFLVRQGMLVWFRRPVDGSRVFCGGFVSPSLGMRDDKINGKSLRDTCTLI